MRYEWNLEPLLGDEPLHLVWDPETGEIGGKGAQTISALVAEHVAYGSISTHPRPSSIDATDPLHSMREMAAILGNWWKLPPELAAAYPKIAQAPSPEPGMPDNIY